MSSRTGRRDIRFPAVTSTLHPPAGYPGDLEQQVRIAKFQLGEPGRTVSGLGLGIFFPEAGHLPPARTSASHSTAQQKVEWPLSVTSCLGMRLRAVTPAASTTTGPREPPVHPLQLAFRDSAVARDREMSVCSGRLAALESRNRVTSSYEVKAPQGQLC